MVVVVKNRGAFYDDSYWLCTSMETRLRDVGNIDEEQRIDFERMSFMAFTLATMMTDLCIHCQALSPTICARELLMVRMG